MPEIPSYSKCGRASSGSRNCTHCGQEVNLKGIASHERACRKKKEDLQKTLEFMHSQSQQRQQDEDFYEALSQVRNTLAEMNLADGSSTIPTIPEIGANTVPRALNLDISEDNAHEASIHLNSTPSSAAEPSMTAPGSTDPPIDPVSGKLIDDAIKIVYHPYSGRAEEIKSLHDYRHQRKVLEPTEEKPWLPFRTRGDYDYAAIALEANLTVHQNNALIALIHRFIQGKSKFTILNNTDLQNQWVLASSKLTKFKQKEFTVKYKKEERNFTVYYRPTWNWALDLLNDARVVSQFNWDARKIYRYRRESDSYVRFYDEPWTADEFWHVQSSFDDKDTKSFAIILYADKNKLSSFGTQKGYPVVARCANLPVSIRNSDGIGGGCIVGWLPIVPENTQDSGKPGFANFKAAVWHRAVEIILRSIRHKSKVGRSVKCGDGVVRHICPHILIISADHEEQGVIALNRGNKGKKACGVCNHPTAKFSNVLIKYSLRTAEDSKAYYELSKCFSTEKSKDFILKLNGLRPVRSAFWDIGHTDVHRALSWDRLHAYHSGLFANHIWPVFCKYFKASGRDTQAKIDGRLWLFPIWRGLYHFDGALKITFNDGRKHEDLSKQLFYVLHDIFDCDAHKEGYLLTRLFRRYLELDTYFSLDLHTEETILSAELELSNFGELLLEYADLTKETQDKDWCFIKAHSHQHACEDIRAKGVTRNYNTKPNEKMHGPLRDIYHGRTNYRDIAPQILKVSHENMVSTFIRSQLDILDKRENVDLNFDDEGEDLEVVNKEKPKRTPLLPPNDKYVLGAPQKPCTLACLEEANKGDPAFKDLRKKLSNYLNYLFGIYNIPLPGNKYLRLAAEHEITEFRFMKVYYESVVTWQECTDYLRCSPKFFGKPRYDFVLYNADETKKVFAQLVFMFAIWIEGKPYPLAIVQTFNAYLGPPRNRDRELGLWRLGMKPRSAVEIVPIASIIRGAVLVSAFQDEKDNEFIVMDLIDGDMFLRCQDLRK